MERSFFVPLIFSFIYLLSLGNGQDIDHKYKSSLVQGILQKVFNITQSSFANIPIEEREKMVVKIKKKVQKSAKFLGKKSGKYVDLIMEGVRSITSKNAEMNNLDDNQDVSNSEEHDEIEETKEQKHAKKVDKNKRYIKKTAENIKIIADKSLKLTKTHKQRKNILSNIQQKVKSAIKKNTSINKLDTPLLNEDIVAQTMIRMIKENAKKLDSKKDDARRMEFEFNDNINVNNEHNVEMYPSKSNDVLDVNKGDTYSKKIEPYYTNVTLKLPCLEKTTLICSKLKALRTIKCSGRDIPVEKLCNDVDDCFNYSDEQDCAIQGVDIVRNASQIMSDIEHSLSNNCYMAKIDDSLIAKQNEILRNVLRSQLKFIQKHATATPTNSSLSSLRRYYIEPENVRKTVNEVALVITSLSTALEHTLCSNDIEEEFRKFNDIGAIEKDLEHNIVELTSVKTSAWSPNSCQCIAEYRVGEYSENCESVCLQRYQLGRFQCQAVSNKKTISLDLICDGKLDCYDEADENGCSTVPGFSKFEASNMYSLVLDMITTKKKSANFEPVRNKLINLQTLVEDLQNLTFKRKPDVLKIKTLRDECFSVMTAIYDQTRYHAESMTVMHDTYTFLISVNEKLVNAMKRSHIGNDRIIAPDGCFCRDNKCALPLCSNVCLRACAAEPKLTRYFCGGSMIMNQSIPIEAICNGKNDCSDKDDEEDCSEDICRKHHLVVLRYNLQEALKRNKDTTIAEALKFWKIKVSATLRILESNERPTPKVLRDIVNDILHDLVMTYASLTSAKRRSNENDIGKFYEMALVVMSSLRSCNK